MSATMDHKQPVRFHFGNAAVDLAHLLPEEDPSEIRYDLQKTLLRCEALFDQIETKRSELSFLVADIKRQIG